MLASLEMVVHGVVVLLVVAVQVWIYRNARWAAREDAEDDLPTLSERFHQDVVERARRGQSPDWLHYRDEIDRLYENRDERIRIRASAALAAGLGGTILALILSLLVGGTLDPWSLLPGMGVALLGSFSGVVNHLLITLMLLPRADRTFHRQGQEALDRLRQVSREHPPAEMFTETLREELQQLREAVGSEFAQSFNTAILGFPEVVQELKGHMDRLADVVEAQAATGDTAVQDLQRCANLVSESSERLRPAAEQLAEVSQDLVAMPERMSGVLDESRQLWLGTFQEEHQKDREQLSYLLEKHAHLGDQRAKQMEQTLTEVSAKMEEIPRYLSEGIAEVSDRLGIKFGREAHQVVLELRQEVQAERESFLEKIESYQQEWRNNVSEVARELLTGVGEQIDEELVSSLQEAATAVTAGARELGDAAHRFEASHRGWHEAQDQSVQGWREAGRRVEEAVEQLNVGDERLSAALGSLAASAEHLERVAQVTEDFEGRLIAALERVTEAHMGHLHPIHQEVSAMVAELQTTRSKFDGIVGQQSEFIRRLIRQLLGRSLPDGEGRPEEAA